MKRGMTFSLASVCGLFLAGGAAADVLLFDITGGQGAEWEAFLSSQGKIRKGSYDLSAQFPDKGILGMDGPVGLEGAGPKTIDSNLAAHGTGGRAGRGEGGEGLAQVGPSAGFGNVELGVIANYFVDSFDILLNDEANTAVEFSALSLLGSNTVDITVYATDDTTVLAQFTGVAAPAVGNRFGIGTDDRTRIGRINIYDTQTGAEGVMGVGTFFTIPAPGALALLGMAGLVGRRRRRR